MEKLRSALAVLTGIDAQTFKIFKIFGNNSSLLQKLSASIRYFRFSSALAHINFHRKASDLTIFLGVFERLCHEESFHQLFFRFGMFKFIDFYVCKQNRDRSMSKSKLKM